ncbi:heterokaryon incompatibility protein [Amniculicola lignicola CBS 123094]|uniref:Heterokaryon incompatibility protein n=1 Tax=Amniculicola lignicola CBS 123094 TaxID=1392246 RepID=A0A6A5WV92_9PLEO|nr:heterokaryon incompatibility protein [Amniculicola lignicola CBS 123094]
MTEGTTYTTTFNYQPLETKRHIRLLQVIHQEDAGGPESYTYKIVHKELPIKEHSLDFEAISYTWGHPARVGDLKLSDSEGGRIGLTKNLTEALPYLSQQSKTSLLWIDQLCVNQSDSAEKSVQIGLMSEIYKKATRVIVWLGPGDESSREMFDKMETPDRYTPGIRSTFGQPATDHIYAPAIREFWQRPWFTRGWIVQEILLSKNAVILAGDVQLNLQDLADLCAIPSSHAIGDAPQSWFSYNILMNLLMYPFTDPQPLRFLRTMAQAASEFATTEVCDSLYAFVGMIKAAEFTPDYSLSTRENFTRFAATLPEKFGSLDMLSMWSANLDELLPNTHEELKGFPSWVPSWSQIPLSAPFRLATGGVRSFRDTVAWNAAKGRKHVHNQSFSAAETARLQVRGRIIDHVEAISSARFARYWDVDDEYLDILTNQIRQDIPDLESWTRKDMISFLNIASCNGNLPQETTEQLLGIEPQALSELRNVMGYNESLGCCLSMGRGRRFMKTEAGCIGLAPFIGTKARTGGITGSVVVILHGCIVPIMLELVDEGQSEYKVLGDCYIEGIMHGEAVTWAEEDTETFVLV